MTRKVELPSVLEQLVNEVSSVQKRSRKSVVDELFQVVVLCLKSKKLPLGIAWQQAFDEVLDKARRAKVFDVPLEALEKTSSRYSGFVGVHGGRGKWYARVPDPREGGTPKDLPIREDALDAAIDRYRWYEDHNLPYGNLGWHIEQAKSMHPNLSMEEILEELIIVITGSTIGLKKRYTLQQAQRMLDRCRATKAKDPLCEAASEGETEH